MKISELRAKSREQLSSMVGDFKKELMNLRFQLKYRTIANTSRIKIVRKTIAKIKTLLNNSDLK